MKTTLSVLMSGLLALSAPGVAKSQFSITATVGGLPGVSGASLATFNESSPSILGLSGSAYLVTGPNYGVAYIPPCFSGSQAAFFGESTMAGFNNYPWDGSQYLAVWDGGSATLHFASPQNYLGLLWSTIGTGDNLTFYDNANHVIGTVSGGNLPILTIG